MPYIVPHSTNKRLYLTLLSTLSNDLHLDPIFNAKCCTHPTNILLKCRLYFMTYIIYFLPNLPH